MKIITIIDFNCPYSYIGLNRLNNAINNLNLNVEWEIQSFELEPQLKTEEFVSTVERYSSKYHLSYEKALEKINEIEEIASEDGLNINFKDLKLSNSKNAHRLVKFSQKKYAEKTKELVEKIFYANFVENKNISDSVLLIEIAVSCGLNENEVRKILESDSYEIEVDLDLEEALFNGITATPYYIIYKDEEKLLIPGVFSQKEFEIALNDLVSGKIYNKTFL